ncbi:unnamed protein product [marine sediment metagenome]|uniref:Uncharacterized protein n=1 Tax=marine sediment metagenome TaxID=412755 RepID=X0W0L4_9ZZZZ
MAQRELTQQKFRKFWALRKKRARAWLALNEWAESCLSEKELDLFDHLFDGSMFFPDGIVEKCEDATKKAWESAKKGE